MERLCGGRRNANLDVSARTQLQESFKPRRRMFRTLALIPVRKQQCQPAQAAPFCESAADELINNDLCAVGEITKLGFPDHQSVRIRRCIAVFKTKYSLFRQQGVENLAIFRITDGLQRAIHIPAVLVMQQRMTMRKCTAADVLAGQPDWETVINQGCIGHGLGEAPVNLKFPGSHIGAIRQNLFHPVVQKKVLRNLSQIGDQRLESLQGHRGVNRIRPLRFKMLAPINNFLHLGRIDDLACHHLAPLKIVSIFHHHGLRILIRNNTFGRKFGSILATHRINLFDCFIHHRLRHHRLIGFIVSIATIADEINDHIGVKHHSIGMGQLCDQNHCFGIISVDMEDRRLHHLGDFSAIHRGPGIQLVTGGKSNLIVDNHVNCSTDFETAGVRHIQSLHDHTLPCESSITMNKNWRNLFLGIVVAAVLTGAYRTLNDRINDLEVGWIEGKRNMHNATRGIDIGRESLVVFDITVFLRPIAAGCQISFKLTKHFRRRLAENVHQHVKPAAMRHTDHHFLATGIARQLHQFIQHRNQ